MSLPGIKMQAANNTSSSMSQLPAALTLRILACVPQHDRLSCAALVCIAWRDAATEATVHINCKLSGATAARFEAWLVKHARQVENLEVDAGDTLGFDEYLQLLLPWARLSALESLKLKIVELPRIFNSSSSTPLLPRLKQLHLVYCQLQSAESLAHLASSTALTSLVVKGQAFTKATPFGHAQHKREQLRFSELLCGLLPQQPQLVELRLSGFSFTPAVIKCLASMQTLQSVAFDMTELHLAADWSADLPSSLTRLHVASVDGSIVPPPRLANIQHLNSLRDLNIWGGEVRPSDLAGMTQLSALELKDCELLPHESPADATAALMQALRGMTQLSCLQLDLQLDTDVRPLQQWSALTASTQLTRLQVQSLRRQPLPQGAAAFVFPSGRLLPHLQWLRLSEFLDDDQHFGEMCLGGDDLRHITSACPRLETLHLVSTVGEGADVSAFCCTALTALTIEGAAWTDAAVPAVLKLPHLRDLDWHQSPGLTDLGLQQLTALTSLTKLGVLWCGISAAIWEAQDEPDEQTLFLEGDDEEPVWQQLQEVCYASPVCAAAARKQMQAAIQDMRQQLADSQAQLAQSQAQLSDSHAQVAQEHQLAQGGGAAGGVAKGHP